uniref:Hypothetical 1.4K protein n=2 Tax=Solanum TaxID=4107 RepID=Q7M2E7_SOLTU
MDPIDIDFCNCR